MLLFDVAHRSRSLGGAAIEPMQVVADGIWTWFTRPEAMQVGSMLYVGWVDSAGTCGATQVNLGNLATKHIALSSVGLEVDDHNNTSFVALPGGKIAAFYGMHNDTTFRYRIYDGTGSFSSSASWTTEEARGTGQGSYSYPNPMRLDSSSLTWLFQRRWVEGTSGATRALSYRTCSDITGAAPHTWGSANDIYKRTDYIPYWRIAHSGDRVHFAITDGHPVQGQISLYHFYADYDGSGGLALYKSDGTLISASRPVGPSNITQIYDGSSVRCWVSDCAVGGDGHPRVLWMKYPGNYGSAIEYWHSRWTGSAWSSNKITDDGAGLYSGEIYYHGGMSFDARDVANVYLSAPISGVRQIQEWRTSDSGATWSRYRQITSGGSAGSPLRARPVSVASGDGQINVLWWEGTYTSFTSYSTSVRASG